MIRGRIVTRREEANRMMVSSWLERGEVSPLKSEIQEDPETLAFEDLTSDEKKMLVINLTGHLSKRQHCIINMHWGITTGAPVSFDKIAFLLGLTEAEVDALYYHALESLKQLARATLNLVEEEQRNAAQRTTKLHVVN